MNKLRLIKIYELRGLIHPIEQRVIELLDSLEKVSYDGSIEYKKKDIYYFGYYHKSNNLWLYSPMKFMYSCNMEELKEIMKYLLAKHVKLEFNE